MASLTPKRSAPTAGSLARYRAPDEMRGMFELAATLLPFIAAWAGMSLALAQGWFWLYALLVVPAAGFLVRLFMIQHDCGHGAFFVRRWGNDWLGRVLGVLTLTPYDNWRHAHAIHHATSGHLDRRGIGDVTTLTVDEYRARSRWGRLRYRLYRSPLVMFAMNLRSNLGLMAAESPVPPNYAAPPWGELIQIKTDDAEKPVIDVYILPSFADPVVRPPEHPLVLTPVPMPAKK